MASSDSDVHISQENQKKINTFAVRNGWLEELETELKTKENDLKNLEDGETEVALSMEPVPILVGESFVHFEPEAAGEELQRRAVKTKQDIKKLEDQMNKIKNEMSALKTELYERFGDNINLENEDA